MFLKSFENYAWATFPVHYLAKVKINFRGEKQIQIISQVSNIAHSVFSGKIVPKLQLTQDNFHLIETLWSQHLII